MTKGTTPPRPSLAFRLGVVGNRDLQDADRAVLTATVQRFFGILDEAIDEGSREAQGLLDPTPYTGDAPSLFVIDSLAEGADQLVADAATQGGFDYRLRSPVPFPRDEYKALFTFDKEDSIATFDRVTRDKRTDPIVVELDGNTENARSDAYAAAADLLLDNCDLLLAVYDPSVSGRGGGTADTVKKASAMGIEVVGIDLRQPDRLIAVTERAGAAESSALSAEAMQRLVSSILVPSDIGGLRRYLREPLITGSQLTRSLCRVVGAVYGAVWAFIPWVGSIASAVRSPRDRNSRDVPQLPGQMDASAATLIDEVQRPYRDRRAPVDRLARFYMSLYRGSFVMNFATGALAVLFGLLSYFHHARSSFWLGAEVAALGIILGNFVGARVWDWHGRALDYRFIAEYLRHMTVLAPLGRAAPLIRPAAQYRGHDPIDTWMAWYVRALERDQGMVGFESTDVPAVLRMDDAFVETMRARLCRQWLSGQLQYYRALEQRSEGALAVFRGLMTLLFAVIAAGVTLHVLHVTIPLDPASWREHALLTILVVALPAFLGALHGIAVQGELEKTADRAKHMSAFLEEALEDMTGAPTSTGGSAAALGVRAAAAARLMLGEVLDWRIIHQAHEVELT